MLLKAARSSRYLTPEAAWTNAAVCIRPLDSARAEGYLRQALTVNPLFPDALMQMASISLSQQEYLRSRGFLSRYESIGPPHPQTLLMRSRVERALGDVAAARKYQQLLITTFPESPEAEQAAQE